MPTTPRATASPPTPREGEVAFQRIPEVCDMPDVRYRHYDADGRCHNRDFPRIAWPSCFWMMRSAQWNSHQSDQQRRSSFIELPCWRVTLLVALACHMGAVSGDLGLPSTLRSRLSARSRGCSETVSLTHGPSLSGCHIGSIPLADPKLMMSQESEWLRITRSGNELILEWIGTCRLPLSLAIIYAGLLRLSGSD